METTDIPPEEIVSDCLKILISAPIKEKIKSIRVSIREKESNGDYPIAEISEIEKYRKAFGADLPCTLEPLKWTSGHQSHHQDHPDHLRDIQEHL